jgi:hypothetical protein
MRNKTALVLGNGPSIDLLSSKHLASFESYGSNHIYSKFKEWGCETNNIVITDHNRMYEIGDKYRDFNGKLFIGDERYVLPPYKKIKRIVGRDFTPLRQFTKDKYPRNFFFDKIKWSKYLYSTVFDKWRFPFSWEEGLNFGRSVIFSAIQIAALNGHKRVLLFGVDANYSKPKDYFNGMQDSIQYVNSRFISNPRLMMEPMLVILQIYFQDMGIELIDCTPTGALKFIPKSTLENFI